MPSFEEVWEKTGRVLAILVVAGLLVLGALWLAQRGPDILTTIGGAAPVISAPPTATVGP